MSTPTLGDTLRRLATLVDVRDADEARALLAAADALSSADSTLTDPAGGSSPTSLLIRDIETLGTDAVLSAARARLPRLLRRLLEVHSLDEDQAAMLARRFGIVTETDLVAALETGRLSDVPGDVAVRLREAAASIQNESRPVPLGRAWDLLEGLAASIQGRQPDVTAAVSGDARRFEPLVSSLALVITADAAERSLDAALSVPGAEVLYRSGSRVLIRYGQVEIDLRATGRADAGSILFETTGPAIHVREVARRRPSSMAQPREADVYRVAGLPWIAPERRHEAEELASLASTPSPRLVTLDDIRGDLHMHTSLSDGQDTLEMMVATAAALGYEYIAITDHSEHAAAVRTASVEQIHRQHEQIELLREAYPTLTILHGIEADILPDGRLDCPDDVLERLDIVLASLHDAAGHDGVRLTARCLQAIAHPLVNVITHPANRLVGRRGRYPLDYDAIFAAAAETGTALEIDGAPSHLDLDGEQAEAAVRAGVTVTIDSDSHRAAALDRQMHMGLGTARRGRVEPGHVLNCRPLEAVRAFIAAKRQRKPGVRS